MYVYISSMYSLPDLVILLALRLVISFLLHSTLTPHQEVLHTEISPNAAADCPNRAIYIHTQRHSMQLLSHAHQVLLYIYSMLFAETITKKNS